MHSAGAPLPNLFTTVFHSIDRLISKQKWLAILSWCCTNFNYAMSLVYSINSHCLHKGQLYTKWHVLWLSFYWLKIPKDSQNKCYQWSAVKINLTLSLNFQYQALESGSSPNIQTSAHRSKANMRKYTTRDPWSAGVLGKIGRRYVAEPAAPARDTAW